ncbi:TAF6L factor, partial [Molothrus ater]|nr:TAF6L factor [Molothrus ater]
QAVCGCGSQDSLPFRPLRDSDLFFPEDREVNLLELALATNIPKGCAETAVRGAPQNVPKMSPKCPWESPRAVPRLQSEVRPTTSPKFPKISPKCPPKYPQNIPKMSPKISLRTPKGCAETAVKSVSHDLEQLSRLLQLARSLLQNPFLCLGSYVGSLMGSVLYCVLEPLAASINPLNDHWTLRDYAALLLGRIFW